MILPNSEIFDVTSEDSSCRLAWVVYTNNYSGNVKDGSDLPCLAHYVSMSGKYLYGNIERRIIVGQCYDFLYDGGRVVLESSPDNLEWDQVGLLSLYNYCKAWDYYNEIGWTGGDGANTPILILNNFLR